MAKKKKTHQDTSSIKSTFFLQKKKKGKGNATFLSIFGERDL
jgi:hypothetical protein